MASPNGGAYDNEFNSVAAVAANDVWGVGDWTDASGIFHPLAEHWDGASWSVVPTPDPGTGNTRLASAVALSSSNVWAVGFTSLNAVAPLQELIEHWDGSAWTVVPRSGASFGNASAALYGVGGDAANDLWAVGAVAGANGPPQTLTVHWDGTAWTVVTALPPAVPIPVAGHLIAVKVLSPNNAWAVGDVLSSGGYTDLVEHWDGNVWRPVATPSHMGGAFLSDIGGTATDLWTVGGKTGSVDNLLAEHWTSTSNSWSDTNITSPGLSADFYGVAYLASGNVYAVGSSIYQPATPTSQFNNTVIERWDGATWSRMTSSDSSTNDGLFATAAISPTDVWAGGWLGSGAGSQTLSENQCTAPTVTSVSPSSGNPGDTVVIAGTHLLHVVDVRFGGAPAFSFAVNSDTQITATVPGHKAMTVDVTVTEQGTSVLSPNDRFTYLLSRLGPSQDATSAPYPNRPPPPPGTPALNPAQPASSTHTSVDTAMHQLVRRLLSLL